MEYLEKPEVSNSTVSGSQQVFRRGDEANDTSRRCRDGHWSWNGITECHRCKVGIFVLIEISKINGVLYSIQDLLN